MNELLQSKSELFKSIGKDPKLREEIIEQANSLLPPVLESGLESISSDTTSPEDRINDILSGHDLGDPGLEAIVLFAGRPVIRVLNNNLVADDIKTESLQEQLNSHSQIIESVVQSVGRIELIGHRRLPWVGTGWIIDNEIMVTNRHVAREFGFFTGTTFSFLPSVFGGPIEASVDFFEEHNNTAKDEFQIDEVLFIEPEGGPDLALLRVNWASGSQQRGKLDLWDEDIDTDRDIAVVGYPAKDTRTNRPNDMDNIFHNVYNVKRFAPGKVMSVSASNGLLTHDCTTLGGNSGSTVVDIETGKAIALHFAGREEDANFAVLAPVIKSRLSEIKSGSFVSNFNNAIENEIIEEKPTVDDLSDRNGYDPDFLGVNVDLPQMPAELLNNLAPVEGRDDGELKYTHYSVLMNKDRRIAYYSVVNIDGEQLHGIPRGSDKWYFDPRIAPDHQVGNDLYKSNPLDRGHLVRRLDPAWGETRSVANLGIEDSFFYTNCAPQHQSLNRHVWLGLEDYILNNSDAFDLKVTVFTGPVFREDDKEYRGIKIPNEFWKVLAMVKTEDGVTGELSVTGYVLSQRSLIDDLEFVFGDHQGYQVKIEVIEELTNLDFGNLKEADPLSSLSDDEAVEVAQARRGRRLFSYNDIVL